MTHMILVIEAGRDRCLYGWSYGRPWASYRWVMPREQPASLSRSYRNWRLWREPQALHDRLPLVMGPRTSHIEDIGFKTSSPNPRFKTKCSGYKSIVSC